MLSLFSLRPAYQVGCYTYYQFNIDEIVEKFCENKNKPQLKCDGKCYLAKTLKMQADTNNSFNDKKQSTLLLEAFFPLFFEAKAFSLNFKNTPTEQKNNNVYIVFFYDSFQEIIDPPPQYFS